ncbi:MAG TPA: Gfo/Idh/MocA family oxidoreductase, partial [Kiritimatiellia bacterium]
RDTLNFALLGAGRWARIYARTIAAIPDLRLAIVARSRDTRPDFVPEECRFTTDWQAAIADSTVDGVIVATPPALHAEMTNCAMRQNKPVLVEKPLTLDVREAESVVEASKSCTAPVIVEHTQLFNPPYRELKRRLPEIGDVVGVHAVAGNWGPFRTDVSMLWDWGAHDVAMYLDLFGSKPRELTIKRTGQQVEEGGMGETYRIEFATPSGAPVRLEFGNLLDRKTRRFIVYGKKATLVMNDVAEPKLQVAPPATPFAPPGAGQAVALADTRLPLTVAVQEFADAIRGKVKDHASLRLGLDVVRTLDLCQRSLA